VVLVDVEISLRANLEIECAVTSHQLEHVIEKANASGDVVPALALDANAHANLCFACPPVDYGATHKPSNASMTISV
jgi:hypothetical protein